MYFPVITGRDLSVKKINFSLNTNVSQNKPIPFIHLDNLDQGGPTSFFPRAKNNFPVGPKGEETPPGTTALLLKYTSY
jgi:hypothetical protein